MKSFSDTVLINLDQVTLWRRIILYHLSAPLHMQAHWIKGITCYFFKLLDSSSQGS